MAAERAAILVHPALKSLYGRVDEVMPVLPALSGCYLVGSSSLLARAAREHGPPIIWHRPWTMLALYDEVFVDLQGC